MTEVSRYKSNESENFKMLVLSSRCLKFVKYHQTYRASNMLEGLQLSHKEIIFKTKENDKSRNTRNIRITVTRVHARICSYCVTI